MSKGPKRRGSRVPEMVNAPPAENPAPDVSTETPAPSDAPEEAPPATQAAPAPEPVPAALPPPPSPVPAPAPSAPKAAPMGGKPLPFGHAECRSLKTLFFGGMPRMPGDVFRAPLDFAEAKVARGEAEILRKG